MESKEAPSLSSTQPILRLERGLKPDRLGWLLERLVRSQTWEEKDPCDIVCKKSQGRASPKNQGALYTKYTLKKI